MKRVFRWIILLNPILLFLFLTVIPFIFLFIGSSITFILGFVYNMNHNDPFLYITLLFINAILLLWTWTVSVELNNKISKKNTKWFKICFWFYLCNISIYFYINLFVGNDFGIWLDNKIIQIIYAIASIYGFLIYISFFYIIIFAARVAKLIIPEKPKKYFFQKLPYWFIILPFPFGMSIIQYELQSYLKVERFFKSRQEKRSIINQQEELEKISELKTLKEDKENHERFMPK